jgi:hypothetical protein
MDRPFSFTEGGDTSSLAVTGTAQNLTLPTMMQGGAVRLLNVGTQVVFVRFDAVTVTVANGMPLMPGMPEAFGIGADDAIQAIAAGAGSTLYATMGDGL